MGMAENGIGGLDLNGLTNSVYLSHHHHHPMSQTLPMAASNKSPSFSANSLRKRPMASRMQQYLNGDANDLQQQQQQQQQQQDCDWDKLEEAAKVIASVQHAFEMSDTEMNDYTDDNEYQHIPAVNSHRSQIW
jgi:hypothetical protein